MRFRALGFMGVSLACGLSAAVVVGVLFQGWNEAIEVAAFRDLRPVVAVVQPVEAGDVLSRDDLQLISVERQFAPDGTFDEPQMAVGRIARERLIPGELLRTERLAPAGSREGLGVLIPAGMRAVGVNVDEASAVSGFLSPGNYVDVVVSMQSVAGKRQIETHTALEAMRVLAIEDRFVTLAASPEEATLLAHGQSEGEVTLTLRNNLDLAKAD